MARHYWFKAHKYSFGWAPASWEGWLVILLYFGGLIYSFMQISSQSLTDSLVAFAPKFLILSALLICVTYLTGEPRSWKWHEKEKSS